jgi:hypothetical protein
MAGAIVSLFIDADQPDPRQPHNATNSNSDRMMMSRNARVISSTFHFRRVPLRCPQFLYQVL